MENPTLFEFNCPYVSASEAGDFIQILFAESRDDDAKYVLLQTQFEFDQDYDFKIETKDGEWIAHVNDSTAKLDRNRLLIDGFDSAESIRLVIDFETSQDTFAETRKILKSMVRKLVVSKGT